MASKDRAILTNLQNRLDSFVGKRIDQVCQSSLGRDFSQNQCAHFVSHMLGYDLSQNASCKYLTFADSRDDNIDGATIRVDTVFNETRSRDRHLLSDMACHTPGLIFVTQSRNITADGRMGNMPAKHIGILFWPWVYHYSNTHNRVSKEHVKHFRTTFSRVYGGSGAVVFYRTEFLE